MKPVKDQIRHITPHKLRSQVSNQLEDDFSLQVANQIWIGTINDLLNQILWQIQVGEA
jgi:hypothetical protein